MSTQREAFEKWAEDWVWFGGPDQKTAAWEAWQASRAAALEEAAQEILKHPVMKVVAAEWATHLRNIALKEQQ